jgi:four helix bundle protein
MIARRFEDLTVWQLASRLQQGVFAFTARRSAVADVKFCDQIRDSSRSAARNTAEGFGRYYPKEFARFLVIAAGSLAETVNHLHDALQQGYVTAAEHEQLTRVAFRALKANRRLRGYLKHAVAPETGWQKQLIAEALDPEPPTPEEPSEPSEP